MRQNLTYKRWVKGFQTGQQLLGYVPRDEVDTVADKVGYEVQRQARKAFIAEHGNCAVRRGQWLRASDGLMLRIEKAEKTDQGWRLELCEAGKIYAPDLEWGENLLVLNTGKGWSGKAKFLDPKGKEYSGPASKPNRSSVMEFYRDQREIVLGGQRKETGKAFELRVEAYLKSMGAPYVIVDEARKALFHGAKLSAFSFVVYQAEAKNWLINAKNRKMKDMAEWVGIFGDGFIGADAKDRKGQVKFFDSATGQEVQLHKAITPPQEAGPAPATPPLPGRKKAKKRLIEAGHKVALCDPTEPPKNIKE